MNENYEGEVSFYCGPEVVEGKVSYLSDHSEGSCRKFLENLFKDYEKADLASLGAAENYHCIHVKKINQWRSSRRI